jgi:uncharacterized protein YggE
MARQFLTHRLGGLITVAVLAGCASTAGEHATTEPPSAATPAATTIPERPPTTDAIAADLAADANGSPAGSSVAATASAPTEPAAAEPTRSITVGGMGAEYGPPSRTVVDIGVSARRPTVTEATQQASAAGAALIAALQAGGIPAEGIQTSQFGINPTYDQYDYARVVGYETQIGYRVTVPDVGELGAVLGRAVESGGDSVRAWSISFAGEPADHMAAARAEAWEDVRGRAAATAGEIGEPLGDVLDVHEKVLVTSPQGMMQGGEGDSASFDIPISPGVVGVIVLLTVTYAIDT